MNDAGAIKGRINTELIHSPFILEIFKVFISISKLHFHIKPLINKHIVSDNVALWNLHVLTQRFIVQCNIFAKILIQCYMQYLCHARVNNLRHLLIAFREEILHRALRFLLKFNHQICYSKIVNVFFLLVFISISFTLSKFNEIVLCLYSHVYMFAYIFSQSFSLSILLVYLYVYWVFYYVVMRCWLLKILRFSILCLPNYYRSLETANR